MDATKWQLKLRVAKFVLSNQTRAACSFDFEITRMITDQIRFTRLHRKIYVFSRWRPFASSLVILLFFSDKPLVLKQFIKTPFGFDLLGYGAQASLRVLPAWLLHIWAQASQERTECCNWQSWSNFCQSFGKMVHHWMDWNRCQVWWDSLEWNGKGR